MQKGLISFVGFYFLTSQNSLSVCNLLFLEFRHVSLNRNRLPLLQLQGSPLQLSGLQKTIQ
jgi:hypothetical protein